MYSASNDLYCTPSQVTYGMLDFFVSFFGPHSILYIFSDFHEHFALFKFLFGFLVFLCNCIFLFAEHGFLPDFVFGQVTSLICWRVDSHRKYVPALASAEEINVLFTLIVLV